MFVYVFWRAFFFFFFFFSAMVWKSVLMYSDNENSAILKQ
jgi:hypothetical protein